MKNIKQVFEIIDRYSTGYLFKKIISKIKSERIKEYKHIKSLFIDKAGIEIGGPSGMFRDKGLIPLYTIIKSLDGCNFSNSTVWEGEIKSGQKYKFHNEKTGVQYISEATDLSTVPKTNYEFVISSNCLEHVANPLKAIEEWLRVIDKNGLILLALPNQKYCFDHKRPVTKFGHLLQDYKNNIDETDITHLDEILALHDLRMDRLAGNFEEFKARSLKNFENRTLHHHVFDISLLKEIFNFFNLEALLLHEGNDFIILGQKKG